MRNSNICYHRILWCCNFRKTAHLSKLTHAHFDHCRLLILFQLKHCKRQANLTVLVSLCLHYLEFRRKRQCYHFLGRCFSDTPCNPNHRKRKLSTIRSGKRLQRFQGIRHCNPRMTVMHRLMVLRESSNSTCFKNCRNINMRIGVFSANRDKKRAYPCLPTIRTDRCNQCCGVSAENLSTASLCSFFYRHLHKILYAFPSAFKMSRTTSRSSR